MSIMILACASASQHIVDFLSLRIEYKNRQLDETTVDRDPIRQFSLWFDEAVRAQLREPNAMVLGTAAADGRPSARVVLLKGFDAEGFVFYTNYASRKGRELAANPRAALVFYWGELERQVRIGGSVAKVSRSESEAYFRTRPFLARVSAVASAQSETLESRATLETRMTDLQAAYTGGEVPLPEYWGGYRVDPESIEFWQGRPNRCHDRVVYTKGKTLGWTIHRLSP